MDKYNQLISLLKGLNSCVIAFSGGMDSTFLLAVANKILKNNCLAITIDTPYIPRWEIKEAQEFCLEHNINHKVVKMPIPEIILNNPIDHCYSCKKQIFSQIQNYCKEQKIKHLFDGSNADDLNDFRPGLKALKELEVRSPLLELGFTKADIAKYSKKLDLPTWDKPPYACLLSRIPVNTKITFEELERIAFHDFAVFESTWFGFIRIGYHVMRPILIIDEGPFQTSGKPCSAPATQTRVFHLIGDIIRVHACHRVLESFKTTMLAINIQLVDIRYFAMSQED